jgi:hypothetical protein
MVEANEVLARLFEKLSVPLLRRIHPEPTPGDTEDLRKAAMVAGFKIPKSPTRKELQGLLNATRGTPAARAVHMAVLRTLTKAEYSPAIIGHFALASERVRPLHQPDPPLRGPDGPPRAGGVPAPHRQRNATSPRATTRRHHAWVPTHDVDSRMCPHVHGPHAESRQARLCTQKEVNAEDAEHQLRELPGHAAPCRSRRRGLPGRRD